MLRSMGGSAWFSTPARTAASDRAAVRLFLQLFPPDVDFAGAFAFNRAGIAVRGKQNRHRVPEHLTGCLAGGLSVRGGLRGRLSGTRAALLFGGPALFPILL